MNGADLRVGGWGDLYYSLLKFDLAAQDLPNHIESATLRLYSENYSDYVPTGMYVDELHTAWTESFGWHDYSLSYTNIGSVSAPGAGWIDVDITAAVNDWLANPTLNNGIQLRPFGADHNMDQFVSSDATGALAQYRPELVINWEANTNTQNLIPTADIFQASSKYEFLAALSDLSYDSIYPAQLFLGIRPLAHDDLLNIAAINLNGPAIAGGIYEDANAAALVVRSSDALFIAFRGTDDPSDISDWGNMGRHYDLFSDLISSIDQYVADHSEITKVYVTGHSMGASMAERFMQDHVGPEYDAAMYSAVTFASPGYQDNAFPIDDVRIDNVHISGDPVDFAVTIADDFSLVAHQVGTYQERGNSYQVFDSNHDIGNDNVFALHSMAAYETVAHAFSEFGFDLAQIPNGENIPLDISYSVESGRWNVELPSGVVLGTAGNDLIHTGSQQDTLVGNGGNDLLTGGLGADSFVFQPGSGNDVVTDFSGHSGQGDHIEFDYFNFASFADLESNNQIHDIDLGDHHNTLIDLGNGNIVTLEHVNLADLTANDFVFHNFENPPPPPPPFQLG